MRGHTQHVMILNVDKHIVPSGKLSRIASNDVEHWLDLCWRASHDLQNLADRSLLFECRGNLTVTSLDLMEKPCSFDRDTDVDRERGKETRVALGKEVFFRRALDAQNTYGISPGRDWHTQIGEGF